MSHRLKKAPGGVHSRLVMDGLHESNPKKMKSLPEGEMEPKELHSLIDYFGEARYTAPGCDGLDMEGPGGISMELVETGSEDDLGGNARIGLADIGGGQAGMTIIGGRGGNPDTLEDVICQEHLSDNRRISKPIPTRPKSRTLSHNYDEEESNETTGLLDPKKMSLMRTKTNYGSA